MDLKLQNGWLYGLNNLNYLKIYKYVQCIYTKMS